MTLCPHCGQPMPSKGPDAHAITRMFNEFWEAYPHKVGKGAALKAFSRVLSTGKAGGYIIQAGLERYKAFKPSTVPWCNPATWLNQERWLDQPQYVDTTAKPEPPKNDGNEVWRVRIRNYLKDGSWPALAPPLEQAPPSVRAEFNLK